MSHTKYSDFNKPRQRDRLIVSYEVGRFSLTIKLGSPFELASKPKLYHAYWNGCGIGRGTNLTAAKDLCLEHAMRDVKEIISEANATIAKYVPILERLTNSGIEGFEVKP